MMNNNYTNFYKKSENEYEFDIQDINIFNKLKKEIKIWDKNRFLHKHRIPDIIENYKNNLKHIPITLIHMSEINNQYLIWDGQHRWYALRKMIKDISYDDEFKILLLTLLDTA